MIVAIFTAFGFFPMLAHDQPLFHVFPYEQAAVFGTAIVAHGTGDGAWFPLMDEVIVVYDGERPVKMCAVSRTVYNEHDQVYAMRRAVYDNNLELVSCVPGGVMFTEMRPC